MLQFSNTVSQVCSLFGLCNVYCWFVSIFANLALPLNQKLKKRGPQYFRLVDTKRGAVDVLKEKLVTSPISSLQWLHGLYTTVTNSGDILVECVLLQEQKDQLLKQISPWSRSSCDARTRYDGTSHKNCLARAWAVLLLRHYLDGTQFIIRTDHQAFWWNLETERLACWRLRFVEFIVEMVYRIELYHQAADAMSLLPKETNNRLRDKKKVDDDIPTYCLCNRTWVSCAFYNRQQQFHSTKHADT